LAVWAKAGPAVQASATRQDRDRRRLDMAVFLTQ
jgi:hypothetical protein